jgi:hypothetical protein
VGATAAVVCALVAGADASAQDPAQRGVQPAYETVGGEDWTRYPSVDALRAVRRFSWLDPRDVYGYVQLVPDGVFGRVARIVFPVNSGGPGPSPRMLQRLPQPLERMWFRWRVRYSPGWTTVGPDPAGHANSYKLAFWGWSGFYSRGEVGLTNTDDYYVAVSVQEPRSGAAVPYTRRPLPGSATGLGEAGPDWADGEWHEFVVYHQGTGATSFREHFWRRRLTRAGRVAPGPWTYVGQELSGHPPPRVDRVELGINKNKSTPARQYLDWGPWEVVDGSRYPNPFGMPGF